MLERYARMVLLTVLVLLVLLAGVASRDVAAQQPGTALQSGPAIHLDSGVFELGDTVELSVSGFGACAGEQVTLGFYDGGRGFVSFEQVVVDQSGSASTTFVADEGGYFDLGVGAPCAGEMAGYQFECGGCYLFGQIVEVVDPNAPTPTPHDLTAFLIDNAHNLAVWVAMLAGLGELPVELSYSEAFATVLSQCEKVNDPESVRAAPHYVPRLHDALIDAIDFACDRLVRARDELGAPQATPEFREAALEAYERLDAVLDLVAPFYSYRLHFRWSLVTWLGPDGVDPLDALDGSPGTLFNDVSQLVTAIFAWDADQRSWQACFPSSGLCDIEGLQYGDAYWIAINSRAPVHWIVDQSPGPGGRQVGQ